MATVLVSGQIGAGKTAVANSLAGVLPGGLIKVRDALREVLGLDQEDRKLLQEGGARLDRRTQGRWLLEYLMAKREREDHLVVDSLRTRRQTVPILEALSDSFLVYLDAGVEVRAKRFAISAQSDPVKRSLSFANAIRHPTERAVLELRPLARLVIPTEELSVDEAVSTIVGSLDRPSGAL